MKGEVTYVKERHDVELFKVRSDAVKSTMSPMMKLAKEFDEPDIGQPTTECLALPVIFQGKAGYMDLPFVLVFSENC